MQSVREEIKTGIHWPYLTSAIHLVFCGGTWSPSTPSSPMVQGHLIASHWISLWCKHNRNVTGKHSDPQQYCGWICRTNLQMRLWSLSWSGEWDEVAAHLCWACSEVSEAEAAVLISILHGPRWLAHAKAITYRTHSLSLIHLELPPALWPPLLIPPSTPVLSLSS